jgi:hypothetical protein
MGLTRLFFSRDGRLMSFDIRLGKLVLGQWELGFKGMNGSVTRYPRFMGV